MTWKPHASRKLVPLQRSRKPFRAIFMIHSLLWVIYMIRKKNIRNLPLKTEEIKPRQWHLYLSWSISWIRMSYVRISDSDVPTRFIQKSEARRIAYFPFIQKSEVREIAGIRIIQNISDSSENLGPRN